MNVHPYAAAFPMMSDDELDALADDIRANGLRHPIVVDADGTLIDGRNRREACRRAGVEARNEILPMDIDPVDYIVGANVERRHLSTGQRAMARAMALAAQGKRESGRWADKAASQDAGSPASRKAWRDAMRQAGLVLDYAPELGKRVLAGDTKWTLNRAYTEAIRIKDAVDAGDERAAELRKYAADLADRATPDTFDDLWDEYRARKAHARDDTKRIDRVASEITAARRSLATSSSEWRDLARALGETPDITQLRAAESAARDLADNLTALVEEYGNA